MSNVFESPHVGVLMDIGVRRIDLENEAKEIDPEGRFGQGYYDFPPGYQPSQEDGDNMIVHLMTTAPNAWVNIVRAALVHISMAESHNDLKDRVLHLGTLMVAWAEDVEARTPIGIEP